MSVYIDPLADNGWIMYSQQIPNCHLIADLEEELHALADKIGLRRAWFQPRPRGSLSRSHYDLTPSMRRRAVRAGAIELSREAFVEKIRGLAAAEIVAEMETGGAAGDEVPRAGDWSAETEPA